MKKIDISTKKYPNTFAKVDDEDFEILNTHKWYYSSARGKMYTSRNIRINGKRKRLYMHTAILGKVASKEIDHRNGDTLDNQRCNLRHCTHAENSQNRKINANSTSGFKGVSWDNNNKKWKSRITHNGKLIHLGLFPCLTKAVKCYTEAAKKYHGNFSSNFNQENKNGIQ